MRFYQGLLVSTKRNYESAASSEINFALVNKLNIEKSLVNTRSAQVSGLITVKLDDSLNYKEIVEKLKLLEADEQFFFHCLKIKPIDHIMDDNLDQLANYISLLDLDLTKKFRIAVTKRHSTYSSKDIISAIAPLIKAKVDLENPDWILLIEILGNRFGISIISPSQIYSTKLAFEDTSETENWFLD